MKGINPFISLIIVVAVIVSMGTVVSLSLSGFVSVQTQVVGSSGTSLDGCGGSFVDVELIDNTLGMIVVSNPSFHTAYIISVLDDVGNINISSAVQKKLVPGGVAVIDLQEIYKTAGIKVRKDYDPENSERDHLSDQDITDAFYKHRKDRHHKV